MMKQYFLLIALSGIAICSNSFAMRHTPQDEEDILSMSLDEIAQSMPARAAREAQEEAQLPRAYKAVKNLLEAQTTQQIQQSFGEIYAINKVEDFLIPTEAGRTILDLLATFPDPTKAPNIAKVFSIIRRLDAQDRVTLIERKNGNGDSAAHIAANLGNLAFFQELFKDKAFALPHNMRNKLDETPLFIAAERGHLPIVQLLVQQGEDICASSSNGMTPLMASLTYRESWDTARYLLEQDKMHECMKYQDLEGNNALHMAAYVVPSEDIFRSILQHSDPKERNKAQQTPLDIAQALLAQAVDPDEQEARQNVVSWLENGA